MHMTHYMALLAENQPWNLLIFMAGPVVLAETVAITELYLLYTRRLSGKVRQINRIAGIAAGVYFAGVIFWLVPNAVLPITYGGEWRTWLDVVAVIGYLVSGLPLILLALLETNLLHRRLPEEKKLGWHAAYVAAFLVFGHLAMIAGMTDPGVLGYSDAASVPEEMSTSVQDAHSMTPPAAHAEH
jgi:hypothetical protein